MRQRRCWRISRSTGILGRSTCTIASTLTRIGRTGGLNMDANKGEVVAAFGETKPHRFGQSGTAFAPDQRSTVLSRAKARYEDQREEEYSLDEYLELCRNDPGAY